MKFSTRSLKLTLGRHACDLRPAILLVGSLPVVPLQGVDELAPGQWLGKRLALPLVDLNGVLDDLAQFRENGLGIRAVATSLEQLRATAEEAAVLDEPSLLKVSDQIPYLPGQAPPSPFAERPGSAAGVAMD